MPASYYLATNSTDVFHYGLLDDGLGVTSGLPSLNFYPSESQLISVLGTLTGNPNYYYENPYELPPTNPFDFSSTGDFPDGVTGGTCSSRITSATGPSNVWYLHGDHDNSSGFSITVTQGPFSVTGKCAVYKKYDGAETGVQIFTQTNKVLPSVPSFNNFLGNYSINEINEGYLYYTGSTYEVYPGLTGQVQGYVVKGDLTNYLSFGNTAFITDPNPAYTGPFTLSQIAPYDPINNLSYIQALSGGFGVLYHSTGQEVSIIVATSSSLPLPPVPEVDSNYYTGTGRSYLNTQDSSKQYFDLFDDALPYILGVGGATGSTGAFVSIISVGTELYYERAYVSSSFGKLGPFTRIRIDVPYVDNNSPITWKIER